MRFSLLFAIICVWASQDVFGATSSTKTTAKSTTTKTTTTKTTKTTTITQSATSTCVATAYADIANVKKCSVITIQGPFTVPSNQVIDLTSLVTGAVVNFRGVITFAHGTLSKSNFLVTISGSSVTVDGTGSLLDGNGQLYWDGLGGNGGVPKPKMVKLSIKSGSVKNLHIVRAPVHCFSIGSSNLVVSGTTIDNRDPLDYLGHNTDAFDISSSTNVHVTGSTVHNQDDCLAAGNKSNNVTFSDTYCSGGH
ncbi:hypothetical protein HK096_001641, partial [Nowakowskiella sp. JEL0078]